MNKTIGYIYRIGTNDNIEDRFYQDDDGYYVISEGVWLASRGNMRLTEGQVLTLLVDASLADPNDTVAYDGSVRAVVEDKQWRSLVEVRVAEEGGPVAWTNAR